MLEQVPLTRLRYLADWSALTKRMDFPVRHYDLYTKNPRKKAEGHAPKRATYFPKYALYLHRKSKLSGYPSTESIKTYKKPIYMFAIQDSFSRFIVHACSKQQPTPDFKNLPWWFDFEDCFKETFETYGRSFEVVVDRFLSRRYSKLLKSYCTILTEASHPAYSASLERFFLSVQHEMRAELTPENLERYVHFYNFQRPHSALRGYTPA